MRDKGTLKEFFEKYPVGGLYFAKGPADDLIEAVPGEARTRNEFVDQCKAASKPPLLVCADGATIGDKGLRPCGPIAVGATESEALAYDYGKALGMQMNYNKIDWILGPCVDIPLFRFTETVSGAMSDDPVYAAKMYRRIVRGIQDQNVAATVKHFPGVGTHNVNMHISPGQNTLPFDEWMNTFGYMYKEMFKEGAMCTMTSHITLRSYSDKADYGFAPIATHSKDITIGLLKKELGFDGVVVTDALTMGGCSLENQVDEAIAAFACGADFLLWPPLEAGDRIVEELEAGRIPMERLDDAIDRIQRFLDKLGIDEGERERLDADPEFVDATFREVFQKGITLIRNEVGNLPLDRKRNRILLDLVASESLKNYADEKKEGADKLIEILEGEGFTVDFKWNYTSVVDKKMNEELKDYDYVIIMLDAPFSVGATRDCFNSAWMINHLPTAKKVILNFSSPYFIDDYYPHEKTFVQMNYPIYAEKMQEVANAILGKAPMTGKLKMNIKI